MQSLKQIFGSVAVVAIAATGVVSTPMPVSAQTYNYGGSGYGSSGVANVSVVSGPVTIVRGDSGAQVGAAINAPVVPGDTIATGSPADAELQFDGTSMLRLANNTQVRMGNLNPGSREIQVAAGTVELAQLQGSGGGAQIDTPSLSVRPNQNGDYRVSVLGNGQTLVTVRSGSATVSSAGGSQTLTPGSTLVATGNSANLQNAIAFDSFDQFNTARDQATVSAYNANPYISPQLGGYSNLANYGQWQNVPGYGYAWAPNNQQQTNFAPYQNGQWVWEPGYGYTWVDNAPYGYTTSHYGSWFNNPGYGGWMWQPPAYQNQQSPGGLASMWLPAVVSFFLSGSNGGGLGNILGNLGGFLGNSGNSNIGWIPLAPGEQYQPWYGGQNGYYPSTGLSNPTNTTNVYNYYSNARYYGGMTMVPVSAWRNGSFRHFVVVRPQQPRQVVFIRGAVPVVPTTANLHYSPAIVVRHPVTLARAFNAPRLAAKAPVITHTLFAVQQSQIRTIAKERPKTITLSPRHAGAPHPVYHPVAHAPVHVAVPKPVTHPKPVEKPVTHAQPATHSKPVVQPKPVEKPVTHPAQKPAAQPKPAERPATVTKPVRTPAPVAKPVVHTAPVAKPAVHAPPVAAPVEHTAPVAKPVVHTAPVVHEPPVQHPAATPVQHPVAPPVQHPVAPPVQRPAAAPKPVETKPVEKKPEARPTPR